MGAEQGGKRKRGHPNLRGGLDPHPYSFNKRQLSALRAICDALLPSLPYEGDGGEKAEVEEVKDFYRLGAVEAGVPQHVAGLFSQRSSPVELFVLGLVLSALSSHLGTLLLCGFLCLEFRWPFLVPFVHLPLKKRQKVLHKWSHSSAAPLRKLFKGFKSVVMFCFYSKVNSEGKNPSWKAIGYTGPEPALDRSCTAGPRPLDGKLLDAELEGADALRTFLKSSDFTLLDDTAHLQALSREKASARHIVGVRCDAVVLGSGSGGGVAAGVLAEGGKKVLVLEQGLYYARDDLTLLEYSSMDRLYLGGGLMSTDCGGISLLAGATVGGGSTVNWAAALRTPDPVRREWDSTLGLKKFSSEEFAHALDVVCSRGSVHEDTEPESYQNAVLRKGCEKLGLEVGTIPNNVNSGHPCGFCPLGCPTGTKQSTAETWLVDAANVGARILTNCRVRSVLHRPNSNPTDSDRKREAVGVVAYIGEGILLLVESRAVVVACGSLSTPPLLIRSGFRNPHIGLNFQIHSAIMAWGYFPEGRGAEGVCYDGPMMTAITRRRPIPDGQSDDRRPHRWVLETPILHPGSYAAVMPWVTADGHKEYMRRYARTASFVVICRDVGSSGTVVPDGGDRVKVTYRLRGDDVECLAEGLVTGLRAMAAAGAVEIGTQHIDGETFSPSGAGRGELDRYLERTRRLVVESLATGDLKYPAGSAHQMGSCRMGRDPVSGAVDPTGRLWEADGVFVADTSVFPSTPGVNPMITCQAVAYCTARSVLSSLR